MAQPIYQDYNGMYLGSDGFEATAVGVDDAGWVGPDASMHALSEMGTIQPIAHIAKLAKSGASFSIRINCCRLPEPSGNFCKHRRRGPPLCRYGREMSSTAPLCRHLNCPD